MQKRTKKLLSLIIAIPVVIGVAGVSYKVIWPEHKNPQQMEQILLSASNKINKDLPLSKERTSILEKTTVTHQLELNYYYKFKTQTSEDISDEMLVEIREGLLGSGLCLGLKQWLINDVKIIYHYKSSDNIDVGNFTISRKDCNY